jgi:hypothetical protein
MVHAYDSTKLSLDEAIVLLILVTHRRIEVKYLKSSHRKELNTMCVWIFIQFRDVATETKILESYRTTG